jgi:hypothetical protein
MGFNIDLTNKNGDFNGIYPLVMTNSLRTWKWTMEIVDLPSKNGGSFHCCVNVYQRVLLTVIN